MTITYQFTVTIQGSGDTLSEAWEDAVSSFAEDPGTPEDNLVTEMEPVPMEEEE